MFFTFNWASRTLELLSSFQGHMKIYLGTSISFLVSVSPRQDQLYVWISRYKETFLWSSSTNGISGDVKHGKTICSNARLCVSQSASTTESLNGKKHHIPHVYTVYRSKYKHCIKYKKPIHLK